MKEIQGDITQVESGFILHQVNCRGVMGSGVALAIKNKYPVVYEKYRHACNYFKPIFLLGMIQIVKIDDKLSVVNLFSQLDYGKDGKQRTDYQALDQCLHKVALAAEQRSVAEIHHPKIGAGLGGGGWSIIKPMIEQQLGETTLWTL